MNALSCHRLLALSLGLLIALPALAQKKDDDAPLPYDDDGAAGDDAPARPKKSRKSERLREEDEDAEARDERLADTDDPNYGVGGEVGAGLMLFDASRGGLGDPRFSFGVRFTWEWGRLIPDEYLREMFFADVQWRFGVTQDGTAQVSSWASQHYFTVAPAVVWPISKVFGLYGQLGLGVNANFTGVRVDQNEVQLQGARFLFQYGVGLRGRPALTEDESVRLTWRVEITRYLRGYMHDTCFGAGVGVLF
ncbi:MAG: porin family protein [Myxococcaceae bacterium]|jgi:hypothetical protein|nr:porin family protein [Myxococcaceae bacterium]